MPAEIWFATARSIFFPPRIEEVRLLYASSLRNFLDVLSVKTFSPKIAVIFDEPCTSVPLGAVVRSLMALKRNDSICELFFYITKKRNLSPNTKKGLIIVEKMTKMGINSSN